jgi:UDP-N-acetyl-D-mannosaminuronate dehydrogenase
MSRNTHSKGIPRAPDVRRLRRSRAGVASYTIRHLAEALRKNERYVTGAKIVFVGFDEQDDEDAKNNAFEILTSLERNGATLLHVPTKSLTFHQYRDRLQEALRGADAILLDTDSRYFRALRPKEIRSFGAPVIIPTSLRA